MKIVTIASVIAAASLFASSALADSHLSGGTSPRYQPDRAPAAEPSGFVKTSSHESSKRSTKPKGGPKADHSHSSADNRKKPKKD